MSLDGKILKFTKNGKIELNAKSYSTDFNGRLKTSGTLF